MMLFKSVVLGALIVEAVCETVKMLVVDGHFNKIQLGSLIFGVAFSVVYGIDLMEILTFSTAVPYAGSVITGILISRGSGFVHELMDGVLEIVAQLESR